MSSGNEHAKRQRIEGGRGVAPRPELLAIFRKYMQNRQKYDAILEANKKWVYSAPMPSLEYWGSLEDEAMVGAAWEFLEQIEKSTRTLRLRSLPPNDINIRISTRTADFSGALPYDDALLPHWKEFASALEQQRHMLTLLPDGKETKLLLAGVELPDVVVDLLSNALHSTHFRAFALLNNNLSRRGIDFALEYAQNNPILEAFGLGCSSDSEFDENDMEKVCDIVRHHPSIKALTLTEIGGNCVDSDAFFQTIMTAAARKVTFLSLTDNSISTGGEPIITDSLRHNSVLRRLDLAWNYLNDADAVMIADALQENTTLRSLTLEGNLIGKEGWTALYKATFDGTSLQTAEHCNHTCYIEYPTSDDDIDLDQELLALSKLNGDSSANQYFCKRSVRRAKIYSVLSTGNRNYDNAQNMGDVPVELLPDLLSTIRKYSYYHIAGKDFSPRQDRKDVRPLSIVYEMMRTWEKVFPLYESLRIRSLNEATSSYYGTCKDAASYADVSLHYDFNQSYYRNCSYRYLTNRLRSAPRARTV